MARRTFLSAVSIAITLLVAVSRPRAADDDFVVITHPDVGVTTLSTRFIEQAFLKKISRWPSGRVIAPVDLPIDHRVRRRFTENVLKRTLAAVRSYWQQKVFSGQDVPPPEKSDEQAVVDFVMKTPGAIGYVRADAPLGRARAVTIKY